MNNPQTAEDKQEIRTIRWTSSPEKGKKGGGQKKPGQEEAWGYRSASKSSFLQRGEQSYLEKYKQGGGER